MLPHWPCVVEGAFPELVASLQPELLAHIELAKQHHPDTTQVEAEKQRKQEVVNSQVQTAGEYLVKPRRSRNTLTSQGSQCRISPEKRVQQSIASRRNSGSVVTFNQMLPRTEMTTQE